MLEYDNEAYWMDRQETIAAYIRGEKTKQKILKIAKKYPGMIAHEERDGRMLAIIPVKCVKIKPTKKIRKMADRDRLYKLRFAENTERN